MNMIVILSILIPTLISFIILTQYKLIHKISISIGIQIIVIFIGSIISIISIFLMDIMKEIIFRKIVDIQAFPVVEIDKLYAIGILISMYMSPFYSYVINIKSKHNIEKNKIYKYIIMITIVFIIISTSILLLIQMYGEKTKIINMINIH